jgi:predicted TPR repeat methyltransferase
MQINLPSAADVEEALAGWRASNPSFAQLLGHVDEPQKALRRFALSLWADGQLESAICVLSAATALAPQDWALWSDLAGVYYAATRHQEAHAAMTRSLEGDPEQPRGWLLLATIAQDPAVSEAFYLKALGLDANLAEASFGLGVAYFQQRRFKDAAEHLRTAVAHGCHTMALYVCLGQVLFLLGDFAAAASALSVAMTFQPDDESVVRKLAQLRLIETLVRGSVEDAIAVYRQTAGAHVEEIPAVTRLAFQFLSGFGYREAAIRLGHARLAETPGDVVQRYLLAALEGAPLTRAPGDYLRLYFDGFAATFDEKLVGALHYHVPEEIQALIVAHGRQFSNMLDLGCGTGLAGVVLRGFCGAMTGVDLSPCMLDQAAKRGLYDRLIEADVADFLAKAQASQETKETKETFDLVVATDLLIYFGDLAEIFGQVAALLAPDGLFAFSIETGARDDFTLLPSGRFAHSFAYIAWLAARDFRVLETKETTIRLEANAPVSGALVVLQRK